MCRKHEWTEFAPLHFHFKAKSLINELDKKLSRTSARAPIVADPTRGSCCFPVSGNVLPVCCRNGARKSEETAEQLQLALDGKHAPSCALQLRASMINKSKQNTAREAWKGLRV